MFLNNAPLYSNQLKYGSFTLLKDLARGMRHERVFLRRIFACNDRSAKARYILGIFIG